jgi:hypothetical protein
VKIKITSSPIGEAPSEVRAAWIGLTLPLVVEQRGRWKGFGVLSSPKTFISQMFMILVVRTYKIDGYIVDAHNAVSQLASHNPKAAEWWTRNAPNAISEGQFFIFDAQACEEIDGFEQPKSEQDAASK